MRYGWTAAIIAVSVAMSGITSGAGAQTPDAASYRPDQRPEATIYRDPGYAGPAMAVQRANPNLGLRFSVQSIRIAGGSWELCPQSNFRGNCLIVRQSTANLGRTYGWRGTLQSIRPVADDNWGGGGGGGQSEALRGMASQYFPQPRTNRDGTNGQRVEACPRGGATAECARRNADAFCQRTGWVRSAYQMMETERGRVYLADVLCVQSR